MVRRILPVILVTALALTGSTVQTSPQAHTARISESLQTIPTYPFSEPNGIPILTKDTRLYPYHSFEGYAYTAVPRQWKVVHLENDWIEVFVLPEVGGKVWGARVKKTGHEFIYRNEVLKFRNIALRGPWTSGGIEFNFGVIGHTPSTATPVDYALKQNPDGSVSCIVGTMDLPSRTEWRVEIRLPADRAAFDTNALWHNPTPLEQPYYNWMTAAAFARDDLELSVPGNAYLQHSGARESWPVDSQGRVLPIYRNNTFGGSKSYHVVGELQDFFGGYYRDAGFGFGHWARHEEMPGQKVWLWALSRSGGIWEDLLTDKDGQYIEFQAGRLLVQYAPGGDVNPIKQAGFDPYATDRWTDTWFPVEGLGGLTEASRDGAIAVRDAGGQLEIGVTAFRQVSDTLRVWSGDKVLAERPVNLAPLEVAAFRIAGHQSGARHRVELRGLGIDYSSDPAGRTLSRPFATDPAAMPSQPEADRLVSEAQELIRGRRYGAARPMIEKALALRPWHRDGLLAMADLEYRRARYTTALASVTKALQLNTYDAEANFMAGALYRAVGRPADARDAFGWAARSLAYRSAANVQLAELALGRREWGEAERYARVALDYNRLNLSAWDILAIVGRKTSNRSLVDTAAAQLLEFDPLHHFVQAEAYLASPSAATLAAFTDQLRSEYPAQTVLDLALGYAERGLTGDAEALLDATRARFNDPLLRASLGYLRQDASLLSRPAEVAFVFPYRADTLPILSWASGQQNDWTWSYLLALNFWALDRSDDAAAILKRLGNAPTLPAAYVSRAFLAERSGDDPESDYRRADELAGGDRLMRIPLIQYYQRVGRWNDALQACTRARTQFPDDFNLALLHVKSLIQLERAEDAVALLDRTNVLPSEGARESHQMYVQAHTLAGLQAIDAGQLDRAAAHLTAALDWPEHLGQGKPYDPEERLIRFVMGRVEERRGRTTEATRAFETVIAATPTAGGNLSRLDLLAVAALRALGRSSEIDKTLLTPNARTASESAIRQMADALARGADVAGIASANPRQFGDLDGTLLVRALSLAGK